MISSCVVLDGAFMCVHMWEGRSGGCECVRVCICVFGAGLDIKVGRSTAEQQGGYLCGSRLQRYTSVTGSRGRRENMYSNNVSFIFVLVCLPLPQKVANAVL